MQNNHTSQYSSNSNTSHFGLRNSIITVIATVVVGILCICAALFIYNKGKVYYIANKTEQEAPIHKHNIAEPKKGQFPIKSLKTQNEELGDTVDEELNEQTDVQNKQTADEPNDEPNMEANIGNIVTDKPREEVSTRIKKKEKGVQKKKALTPKIEKSEEPFFQTSLFFEANTTDLTKESQLDLINNLINSNELLNILNKYPENIIEIHGYSDRIEDKGLRARRAKSIKDVLREYGEIKSNKIKTRCIEGDIGAQESHRRVDVIIPKS